MIYTYMGFTCHIYGYWLSHTQHCVVPMTNVWHKILNKRSSWKKIILLMFVKIVENWKPLSYYYKCTTQNVFCILIAQLLRFWKIEFEIVKPCFLKINKYSAKECQTFVVGMVYRTESKLLSTLINFKPPLIPWEKESSTHNKEILETNVFNHCWSTPGRHKIF
jgi:hypothetical protein